MPAPKKNPKTLLDICERITYLRYRAKNDLDAARREKYKEEIAELSKKLILVPDPKKQKFSRFKKFPRHFNLEKPKKE